MSMRSMRHRVALALAPMLLAVPVAAVASPALAGVTATAQPSASSGFLFVTNATGNSVTEYRKNASGDTSPHDTIAGTSTGLSDPLGIAVDSAGHLWVTNATANSVTEYRKNANGDTSPIDTIAGASTGLSGPRGIAVTG